MFDYEGAFLQWQSSGPSQKGGLVRCPGSFNFLEGWYINPLLEQ
jgi:hypothetical protein